MMMCRINIYESTAVTSNLETCIVLVGVSHFCLSGVVCVQD